MAEGRTAKIIGDQRFTDGNFLYVKVPRRIAADRIEGIYLRQSEDDSMRYEIYATSWSLVDRSNYRRDILHAGTLREMVDKANEVYGCGFIWAGSNEAMDILNAIVFEDAQKRESRRHNGYDDED